MSRVSNFRERQRANDLVTVEVKLSKHSVNMLNMLSKAMNVSRVSILSRELSFLETDSFKYYCLQIFHDAEKKENTGEPFKSFLGF